MEPDKPEPTDCCGGGCSPCVFDIYEQRLKSWREGQLSEDTSCKRHLLSETHFKPFRLLLKEKLTEDVYLYQFRPDSNGASEISGFLPYGIGQHLIVRCRLNSENKDLSRGVELSKIVDKDVKTTDSDNQRIITRAYTPVSLAKKEKDCCFRIFIKLYENGIGSDYFRRLQVGDISFWRGPYGEFNYKPNSFKYMLMLCVGTGLAPMIPIADCVLSNDSDETVLHLIYGVKSIEHIIMRDNLRRMTQFWNFTLEYFFSENKTENNNIKFGESFKNNRVDQYSVREFVEGKDLKMLQVLVCGTDSFTSSIKNIVSDLCIDPNNIFVF